VQFADRHIECCLCFGALVDQCHQFAGLLSELLQVVDLAWHVVNLFPHKTVGLKGKGAGVWHGAILSCLPVEGCAVVSYDVTEHRTDAGIGTAFLIHVETDVPGTVQVVGVLSLAKGGAVDLETHCLLCLVCTYYRHRIGRFRGRSGHCADCP